jgi:hypothetical protein
VIVLDVALAPACGFIQSAQDSVTLRESAAASKFVVFGTFQNAKESPDGDSTEFVITRTVKTHPVVAGRKLLRIPRFVPTPEGKPSPGYLLFGEIVDGKPDVSRGVVGTPALAGYVEGALGIDGKDRIKVMRYCSPYFEDDDSEINGDAFIEFMKSTDSDIRKGARFVAADRLRAWLRSEHTLKARRRLYAFLLAQWGNQEDAASLRTLLDRDVRDQAPLLFDGVLTGYTILDPKKGWAFISDLLKDPTATFMARYSAQRAARYFHLCQPEIVSDNEILKALQPALEQHDMADLVIDYLRDWRCWKLSAEILALSNRKGFEVPLIRNRTIRYALQCPDPRTAAFIANLRATDAALVEEIEERLGLEAKPAPATP